MRPDEMTPAEASRWCDEWERYACDLTDLRTAPADVLGGFIATLAEIRTLPEVK